MPSPKPLMLGAVAYDPKVVTIWEGFKAYFEANGLPFDFILYSNYEAQVEGLLAGHCQVAWNSPLAWIEARRAAQAQGRRAFAIAMRDTDQDLTSLIVARADGPLAQAGGLAGLKGRRVAVGADDSPQATLIPLLHLDKAGLAPEREVELVRFNLLPGKHGDHIGGEREAARALMEGRVEAACMIDGNHLLFSREGLLPPGKTVILAQTAPYDHCNFTVLDGLPPQTLALFERLLLAMRYEEPSQRMLMDLEGLKKWLPGRLEGYGQLEEAVDRFGFPQPWLNRPGGRP